MREPNVHVGIQFEPKIEFILHAPYSFNNKEFKGLQKTHYKEGKVAWNDELYDEIILIPDEVTNSSFELIDVTIGINFHWERQENQRFKGALRIIPENNKLTAINILSVEDYLISVISSEMSAKASLELLKAHAVISRSWLLAQIEKNKEIHSTGTKYHNEYKKPGEYIIWYDREDHTNFDVCADDHCQRYQGITRASTPAVSTAVNATKGEVLTYKDKICDARFSKCCGGVFEEFATCWEDAPHPYLVKRRDDNENSIPDLTNEDIAQDWIRTSPKAYCNTTDINILAQVLNNYDQETTDFYRWKITYTQDEISNLIKKNTGIDFGSIIDLIPISRGTSSRLIKLKIVGTKKSLIIGKELEIRRVLSTSHLYSSAFVVDKKDSTNDIPTEFTLTGAGWGHGVGLCQIGAAVMGEKGDSYDNILYHYYIGADITKRY